MLAIRMQRVGRKKQPLYRLVVSEKTKDMYGNHLEILGTYNPHTKDASLKEDRIQYWLEKGAQASESLHNLLVNKGLLKADKQKAVKISKKRQAKQEKAKADAQPKEEKPAETEGDKPAEGEVKPEAADAKPEEPAKEEIKEDPKAEEKPATEEKPEVSNEAEKK